MQVTFSDFKGLVETLKTASEFVDTQDSFSCLKNVYLGFEKDGEAYNALIIALDGGILYKSAINVALTDYFNSPEGGMPYILLSPQNIKSLVSLLPRGARNLSADFVITPEATNTNKYEILVKFSGGSWRFTTEHDRFPDFKAIMAHCDELPEHSNPRFGMKLEHLKKIAKAFPKTQYIDFSTSATKPSLYKVVSQDYSCEVYFVRLYDPVYDEVADKRRPEEAKVANGY